MSQSQLIGLILVFNVKQFTDKARSLSQGAVG